MRDTSYMPTTINPFCFEIFHFTCLKMCCFIAIRVYVDTADKKSLTIHLLISARALGEDFCFHFYCYHNLITH